MKVIFMGAPAFAVPTLEVIAKLAPIAAVYTKAPRPAGRRGLDLTRTPVHLAAERLGLAVETPTTLRDPATLERLAGFGADFAIVAAYGLILPAQALAAFPMGCVNLHASLLPRWRGAAPVQRVLMAGDEETGVALMRMEAGLDTGPIAGERRTRIEPLENSEELTARLAGLAAETLHANWDALASGRLVFQPQSSDRVAYACKVEKSEAPIDWRRTAREVRGHIHGLAPFPGATCELGGERVKILRAETVDVGGRIGTVLDDRMTIACGEGGVRVLEAQRPGRNVVSGDEFMRAGRVRPGDVCSIAE